MRDMLRALDDILNKITMYKLVQWGLRILAVIAIIFSLTGVLQVPAAGLLISLGLLSVSAWAANEILSRVWRVPANAESYAITLLILFFILPPATTLERGLLLIGAGVLAVASKFIINVSGKHIFNPAAFAAVALGLAGLMHATWWVGSSLLWPLTLLLGLLIVRKIRRFSLLTAFAGTALTVIAITALAQEENIAEILRLAATSSPLIFLGTIMLTEPATMPARRRQQIIFGALVGFLYAMPWNIGPLTVYPETALLIGNLYAFAVNPRYRLKLRLKEIQEISDRVSNYVFTPDRRPKFVPGQYMEWTLPMIGPAKPDARGNRRTFSIASSPTEDNIQMGVKFYEPSSAFKRQLRALKPGDHIYAGQIAGDFTLPKDPAQKLVFIAAGIGVTPFRSMLKYIVDTEEKRDVVMLYAVADPSDLAYEDVLEQAAQRGIRVIPLLTNGLTGESPPKIWKGSTGKLDTQLINNQIPDYRERLVYVSGPNGLVENIRSDLLKSGVSRRHIKTDYFTGY